MSPKPSGRLEPPKTELLSRDQRNVLAHQTALTKALNAFAKAAMAVQDAERGTIGRRAAESHAKQCRSAVENVVRAYLSRERLDAHAGGYERAAAVMELLRKHSSADGHVGHALTQFATEVSAMLAKTQRSLEAQRAAIDEQARLGKTIDFPAPLSVADLQREKR